MPKKQATPWIPALLKETQSLRKIDRAGVRWSQEHYDAGYTSYSSVTDLPFRSTRFARLKSWIDGHVHQFSQYLEMDLKGGRLEMVTCWVNIMGRGSHHSFHLHPLSAISGTFYLQAPKGSGSFKIEDPRLSSFMGSPPRKHKARPENRRHLDLEPKAGRLVLFESWLKHEVPANLSDEERISVSFNYDWVKS